MSMLQGERRIRALATLALALMVCGAGCLLALQAKPALVQAQPVGGGQIVFTGTIRDSIGAPPPAYSALQLVAGPPIASNTPFPNCAAGSSDPMGNFRLILEPYNSACTIAGTGLSLRVNGVPASQTVQIPAAPGTYPINFTVPVPLGGQPLPLPAQTAVPLHTTALVEGCTQVVVSLGAGATPSQVVADVANISALVSIWHFDNADQRFLGYFPGIFAPSDLTSLAPVDVVFICVNAATSITAP